MNEIKHVRVDDRLVHGQIVTSWIQAMDIDTLLVIDDEASKDDFRKMILKLAVPHNIKFQLLNVEDAVKYLSSEGKDKVFVIFGCVETVLRVLENKVILPEVNLGNIGTNPERKQISKAVWLTNEEIETVRKIAKMGTDVQIHLVPHEKKESFNKIMGDN